MCSKLIFYFKVHTLSSSATQVLEPHTLVCFLISHYMFKSDYKQRQIFPHGNRSFKRVLVCFKQFMYIINFTQFKDIILISLHSFFLHQQKNSQPVVVAQQKYKASKMHGRVQNALEEVFKQFGKASFDERVDMVANIILHHTKGRYSIYSLIFYLLMSYSEHLPTEERKWFLNSYGFVSNRIEEKVKQDIEHLESSKLLGISPIFLSTLCCPSMISLILQYISILKSPFLNLRSNFKNPT